MEVKPVKSERVFFFSALKNTEQNMHCSNPNYADRKLGEQCESHGVP